jgi:hypothetical protein
MARYGHWTQDHLDAARVAAAGMYGDSPANRKWNNCGTRLMAKSGAERN